MFKIHRQPQGEGAIKKSKQKLLDPKKDIVTRFKHLKNIILNSQETEVQAIFELHYSHVYFVFFENFLLAEANLRQKGSHRAQREELDAVLEIFEQILINLPELIHQRWQYNSIDMVIKRLLHTQNSLKVRREGMHFFLLWLRALQENALPHTLLLYACLVPGFPPPTFSDGKPYSLEWLVNMPINEEFGVHQVEIACLVPPPSSGEKIPNDLTKYFLDAMLEFMVLKSHVLRWKDVQKMAKQCFSFLWNLFKENYIPHAFPDFDHNTSIYNPALTLPEPRDSVNYVINVTDSGSLDPRIEVASGCSMLSSRVSIIKWIVNFTERSDQSDTLVKRPDATVEALHRQVLKQLQEIHVSNNDKGPDSSDIRPPASSLSSSTSLPQHLGVASVQQHDNDASNSNTSTLTEKEPSLSSLSSLDDKLRSSTSAAEALVQDVLYATRQNVNIIHEMFRQAFMLPLTEVPTMRRVVKVYQEWIQDGDMPLFMEDEEEEIPPEDEESTKPKDQLSTHTSSSSLRNESYIRGQLHPVIEDARSNLVRAGRQSTLQLFVTNSAHVFLVEPPSNATKLIESQVDVCKRVLNLYRHMVMNVHLSDVTWRQLLRVLVHVTRSMLQDPAEEESEANSFQTVTGKLAGPVFQTLIVSWIKANLFVHVSRELWDELVDVLSSLTHWEVLITEWAKNMETMTRVLARHVYKLELQDLPLDRLTEQKHKRQKKAGAGGKRLYGGQLVQERSFSRGWSRDSSSLISSNISETEPRTRSQSALVARQPPQKLTNFKSKSTDDPGATKSLAGINRIEATSTKDELQLAAQRVTSDTELLSSSNHSSTVPPRRRNSASDVSEIAKERSMSPMRHRSDSEGVHIKEDDHLPKAPLTNGLHVAWQDPTHEVHQYPEALDGDTSTNVSVQSLEGDDMFDELIHERLHYNEKDTASDEIWPNEAPSLHSQDSVSIDPNWNPWADGQSNTGHLTNSDADGTSNQETLSMDVNIFDETPVDDSPTLFDTIGKADKDRVQPKQRRGPGARNQEDIEEKEDEMDIPGVSLFYSDSPALPISPTPPAIPARVALPPKHLNLFDIDYLSTHSDSSEITTPSHSGDTMLLDSPVATTPTTTTHKQQQSPVKTLSTAQPTLVKQTLPVAERSPQTPPQTEQAASPVERTSALLPHSDLPSPTLSRPSGRLTNSSPQSSCQALHGEILAEGKSTANIITSRDDEQDGQLLDDISLNQSSDSHQSEDRQLVPEPSNNNNKSEDVSSCHSNSDLPPKEDSLEERESAAEDSRSSSVTASSAVEESVSMDTCDVDVTLDVVPEDEAESLVLNDPDPPGNILLQNCSTPQQASTRTFEDRLNDTSFEGEILPLNAKEIDLGDCSIMAGGQRTGWFADVAVALWRRLLGVLGDINQIVNPDIHQEVFSHLLEFWGILFKMRQNLGLTGDNQTLTDSPELVPPLTITAPWAFKATMSLPESHKGGKLHAYQLLCNMTVQREHDTPLEADHLAQFYVILHSGLHSTDTDIVSEIVGSCGHYFSSCLPGSTLLLLDFIYACHVVAASSNLKAPRVEAQTILGSSLCFPNVYHDIPVLKPESVEPTVTVCNNMKDYVVDALLTSGKKEPSANARCVALSSTGLWLYEELTSCQQNRHARIKEAINVLLVTLKFNNRSVACVACTQLHLLTHCSDELLQTMPEMPPRIIEVMSLSVSALLNDTEAKNTESGRQLLVTLLLCILDWCMSMPLHLLVNTYGANTEKRLIRTVFKAMQTAALGKPGHSAKHSYSLSDLASKDFDPNLPIDTVQESPSSLFAGSRPKSTTRNNAASKLGKSGAVSLVAHTVLAHLTNHLGHFPLARGTSVLTCRVSEHHDSEIEAGELSPKLFQSPNVQFLIFNDSCLLSVVELPAKNGTSPGTDPTAGLSSSNRCVRFIVRDAGGKYCWDANVLYGPPDVNNITRPVRCEPLSTLDAEISQAAKEICRSYLDYAQLEADTNRKVAQASLPNRQNEAAANSCDKLDQLLQYLGWSSPECQGRSGFPLNIPAPVPSCISPELQEKASLRLLRHHEELGASYAENACATSWQCAPVRPRAPVTSHSAFHHARMLCVQMGFLARDNRDRVSLLTKNERLLRELKNLDSRRCRDTHKVAVFYIAQGQEDKLSVLSNTGGSKAYEDFVSGLGWEVDLRVHCGFSGKLLSDGSTGKTAPYYASSTVEVIFHVSTRFPSTDDAARNVKLKHLGNDEVHIVWSEHHRDYRRGIIPTEFGDVLIVIYPLRHGLYRVQINKKADVSAKSAATVPYFGPLFDGAIVNSRVLPILVRETAINAGRAKRSQISLYQPYYEERTRYLRLIVEQFKDETTFEDYSAHLFCPAPMAHGSSGAKARASTAPAVPDGANANGNNNRGSAEGPASGFAAFLAADAIQSDHKSPTTANVNLAKTPFPAAARVAPPASHSMMTSLNPPPSTSLLSTSVPPIVRTMTKSAPGHKPHVTFHLSPDHMGGSQSQIEVGDFPTPPTSPPSRVNHPHQFIN